MTEGANKTGRGKKHDRIRGGSEKKDQGTREKPRIPEGRRAARKGARGSRESKDRRREEQSKRGLPASQGGGRA